MKHNAAFLSKKHLDLGCGLNPRNPYSSEILFGIDIRDLESQFQGGVGYRRANLLIENIPFPTDFFGSVSAFDFVEHIPRVMMLPNGETKLPFIDLMSEIWRVLENGGRFYAVTPAYPSLSAFQDPTHVNFITKDTHDYFCGHSPDAVIYGFKGKFNVIRAEFVIFSESLMAKKPSGMAEWRRYRRDKLGRLSHFLWELEAVK